MWFPLCKLVTYTKTPDSSKWDRGMEVILGVRICFLKSGSTEKRYSVVDVSLSTLGTYVIDFNLLRAQTCNLSEGEWVIENSNRVVQEVSILRKLGKELKGDDRVIELLKRGFRAGHLNSVESEDLNDGYLDLYYDLCKVEDGSLRIHNYGSSCGCYAGIEEALWSELDIVVVSRSGIDVCDYATSRTGEHGEFLDEGESFTHSVTDNDEEQDMSNYDILLSNILSLGFSGEKGLCLVI